MGIYKQKFNPVSGQFNLVSSSTVMTFKEGVATASALPPTGNTQGDARIANDTGHLYIWDGSTWVDQGDIIDLTWSGISGKPTSTPTQIDAAVSDSHAAHSDDQDLSGKVDKETGKSLVADTEISKIHALHADDQDLSGKEDVSNKSTNNNLGSSDTLYPSQKAVKEYVSNLVLLRPTTYYFTDEASGIGGFYLLSLVPDLYNQINDIVTLSQNISQYFPKQFASTELGGTEIPSGVWEFNIFRKVDNSAGTTSMSFEIYKRTSGGSETLLFTVNLGEINDTVPTLQRILVVQQAFAINPTDVLVIKAQALATKWGTTILQYQFGGETTYSHIFKH
jgi:hypothetical protein